MSFPQSTPAQAILAGQEVWRLFTDLESSGDIYEAEVSTRALVIGPESDVSSVQCTYFDPTVSPLTNSVEFSIDKPWIARLDALPGKQYQTGDAARLLFSTTDLLPPPGFRPPSSSPLDPVETVIPNIDLLFYLNEQPNFIAPRSDRVHLFEQLPDFTDANDQWFLVPFYGRHFSEVTCKNLVGSPTAVTVTIYGINFSNVLVDASLPDNGHQQETLGTYVVAVGATDTLATVSRSFDYLAIQLDNGAGSYTNVSSLVTHITVRDRN